MKVLILTPIFPPTTGGASTYYATLVREIFRQDKKITISVITERISGRAAVEKQHESRLSVFRVFPYRAGRHLGFLSKLWRYAIQNVQYLFLPWAAARLNADLVIIHSSFHNHANLLHFIIPHILRRCPVIADVRDQQLPLVKFDQLNSYSAIICCSLNVMAHINQSPSLARKSTHIPVIQTPISKERHSLNITLQKFKLLDKQFILFSGLLKEAKGVGSLLKAFEELQHRSIDVELILAGINKDPVLEKKAMHISRVKLLGEVAREELLDLMSAARININPSSSEGMPRSSLEALALGASVLLPRGIPEFEISCPKFVIRSTEHTDLADQIQSELLCSNTSAAYPISDHDGVAVSLRYISFFQTQVQTFSESKI